MTWSCQPTSGNCATNGTPSDTARFYDSQPQVAGSGLSLECWRVMIAATSLRSWQPLLIPGLLQTADYARAILSADPETTEDQLAELVEARLGRQVILDRAAAPNLWAVLDEAVLHRLIGSRKTMYDQLLVLADASCRPNITVQIVPAEIGAHAGLLGGFAIASFENAPSTVYMESPDQGQTTEAPSVVRRLSLTFDTLRADALPRGASRDLIGKVAEERWATT
jgi:hypothetical protein